MSLDKVLLSSSLYSNRRVKRKSKDEKDDHIANDQISNNDIQCGYAKLGSGVEPATNNAEKFHKTITEKEVKIKLFILEACRGFQNMNIKERIAVVLKQSDSEFQEFLYNRISEEKYFNNYEEFRTFIINYCTSKGIEKIKRSKEENWSEY
ncbi:hypothetical protein DMUE_4518 [Dictyocoela muelleri]|nr:hypothetical protein DMUE_4518 [Dictyocoela muelleri]